jgi:thiol-disulfide isomerase/thioredoxin
MSVTWRCRGPALVVAAAVVVALAGCSAAPAASVSPPSGLARVGDPAPVLSLPVLDGGTHDLVRDRGKVVVLNFWATWCVPCRQEMPELQRLADGLRDTPFTLLTVDLGEDSDAIAGFRNELGLRLPVLMDQDSEVADSYGVRALPATFLIDADGTLRQQRLGPLLTGEDDAAWSRAWLASRVRALLETG